MPMGYDSEAKWFWRSVLPPMLCALMVPSGMTNRRYELSAPPYSVTIAADQA